MLNVFVKFKFLALNPSSPQKETSKSNNRCCMVYTRNYMTPFQTKVLSIVSKIPSGKVLTYGQVAQKAGNPKASRAVGSIMAKNQDKNIPCHRVVRSDGSIGMYNGLRGKSKSEILKKEGVQFSKDGKAILQ